MKRLIAILVVAPLCAIGAGFARGWFAVSKAPDKDDNKTDLQLTVDPCRMKADLETLKDLLALTAGVVLKVYDLPTALRKLDEVWDGYFSYSGLDTPAGDRLADAA